MQKEKHLEYDQGERTQPEPRRRRSHAGAKLTKILLPLIAAALCLADAIECILWSVPALPCLLLFAAGACYSIAAWLFLGYELGLHYDKEEEKVTYSNKERASRQANNQRGWILVLVGTILFACAILAGNMVPLAMFYALLMS